MAQCSQLGLAVVVWRMLWQCGASPANSQILLRTGRPAVAQFYLIGEVCKLHSVRGLPQTSKKDDSLRAKKMYIYTYVYDMYNDI